MTFHDMLLLLEIVSLFHFPSFFPILLLSKSEH